MAIAQNLAAQDPGNAGWQRDLSVSHTRLATVHAQRGNYAAAAAALRDALAVLDGMRDRGMHLDPQAANLRTHLTEQIAALTAAQAGGGPPLPPGVVSFAPRAPAALPAESRGDAVARARVMLANNNAVAAAALLAEAPPSPSLANARAVCALRLGEARAAIDLLHPAVLPDGVRSPPETTPDAWIITYATALALAGDPGSASRALEWVKDVNGGGAARLRRALTAWHKSLTWKDAARYRLTGQPPHPVTLDFPPGEL